MKATPSFGDRPLVDAALRLTFQAGHEGVCHTLLDVLERTFDAHSIWILLRESRSRSLVTAACRGAGADVYAGVEIPSNAGVVGLAFSSGEPVFVPDVRMEDRWLDAARVHESGLPSILTVPLLHRDERVGVIGFHSPRFGPESPPTVADLDPLRGFAALATLALTNARLTDELESERARRAREARRRYGLLTEVHHLCREIREGAFGLMVGDSSQLRATMEQAEIVAPTDTTVLLQGETGTGKELIARAIHDRSRRSRSIFVAVNCAAIPMTLIESDLFGHEKGAFTGALARKPGKFELSDGGTIFLDEIGDLALEAQAKLLRVLQEREVTRVGGTKPVAVNSRVIAATNQNLLSRVQSNLFRADLFYRLSVFPIAVPSLRERPDDIPALVQYFIERFASSLHTPAPEIDADAMTLLMAYEWPGNVRELQNVIERAVIVARGGRIRRDMIASTCTGSVGQTSSATGGIEESTPSSERCAMGTIVQFAEAERRAILHALDTAGWRISGSAGAAEILGLKPTTLHAKMKKLGVRRPGSSRGYRNDPLARRDD